MNKNTQHENTHERTHPQHTHTHTYGRTQNTTAPDTPASLSTPRTGQPAHWLPPPPRLFCVLSFLKKPDKSAQRTRVINKDAKVAQWHFEQPWRSQCDEKTNAVPTPPARGWGPGSRTLPRLERSLHLPSSLQAWDGGEQGREHWSFVHVGFCLAVPVLSAVLKAARQAT